MTREISHSCTQVHGLSSLGPGSVPLCTFQAGPALLPVLPGGSCPGQSWGREPSGQMTRSPSALSVFAHHQIHPLRAGLAHSVTGPQGFRTLGGWKQSQKVYAKITWKTGPTAKSEIMDFSSGQILSLSGARKAG